VSAATAVPSALPVNRDGIPSDIANRPQWVGWRWERIADDERWTKVPLNPLTGKHASSTNAQTWATLDVALAFAERE
jgi:primase-polymerase (primpol)-like protein